MLLTHLLSIYKDLCSLSLNCTIFLVFVNPELVTNIVSFRMIFNPRSPLTQRKNEAL
ncbi:hypothetical protein BDV41DRAFT_527156 [Aspergillus transmontanensis]|uniref:Uncharacterized protein n=1 Tax=Aspergillus transmontanensis TaxID=1034304 RepID=A0A5N6WBR9_9EURO|nr:hypothetical protein BDV41DRAFT_527156 [Aspergillus transmontanensis]